MGTGINGGVDFDGGASSNRRYTVTQWHTIHDDCTETAQSAAQLLRPATYSSTNIHPIRVPASANRVLLRLRYSVDITALTGITYAVYAVHGLDSGFTASTGAFADDGSVQFMRIDQNLSTQTGGYFPAAYPTLTGDIQDLRDTTYRYGSSSGEQVGTLGHTAGLPLFNAKWLLVLPKVKATITTTGSSVCQLQCAFIDDTNNAYAVVA